MKKKLVFLQPSCTAGILQNVINLTDMFHEYSLILQQQIRTMYCILQVQPSIYIKEDNTSFIYWLKYNYKNIEVAREPVNNTHVLCLTYR